MNVLKEVRLMLSNIDPAMNVITVAGRSGKEYLFVWDERLGLHVRSYRDFDQPGEIDRLNEEGHDLAEAIMPPGWTLQREFGFEEVESPGVPKCNAEADFKILGVLRQAVLSLLAKIDPEAAQASFSEEDWESFKTPLRSAVKEVFAQYGLASPVEAWEAAAANEVKFREQARPARGNEEEEAAEETPQPQRKPGRPRARKPAEEE